MRARLQKVSWLILVALLVMQGGGISTSSAAADDSLGAGRSAMDMAPAPSDADWSQAGYPGNIPYVTANVINVRDFGATGNGSTDDSAAIQAAIDSAPNPAVIFFRVWLKTVGTLFMQPPEQCIGR